MYFSRRPINRSDFGHAASHGCVRLRNEDVEKLYDMVPVGTPRPIIQRLQAETAKALATPEIRKQLVETGAVVGGNSTEEFAAFVQADRERWKKALADSKIEPN